MLPQLDVHDDHGALLKGAVAFETLPDFIKEASFAGRGELSPEDFSLILTDADGTYPRFPRNDAGNTAISTRYLTEHHNKLSEMAVKTASHNLAVGCRMFGLPIPEELLKLAGIQGPEDVREKIPYVEVHKGLRFLAGEPKRESVLKERKGHKVKEESVSQHGGSGTKLKTSSDRDWVRDGTANHAKPLGGASPAPRDRFPGGSMGERNAARNIKTHEDQKAPRRSLSESEVNQTVSDLRRRKASGRANEAAKRIGATGLRPPSGGYHNLVRKQSLPAEEPVNAPTPGGQTAAPAKDLKAPAPKPTFSGSDAEVRSQVPARFGGTGKNKQSSISYAHTKAAADHFNENWKRMDPRERVKVAQAIVPACKDLGIELVKEAYDYSSGVKDMGRIVVSARVRKWYTADERYDELEKQASSMEAPAVIEKLWELDTDNGVTALWGGKIPDPFLSVMAKQAEAESNERFIVGNDYTTAEDLKNLATNRPDLIKQQFSDSFAAQFLKSPVTVFKSLPLTTQQVLMRMSSSNTSGVSNEG